MKKLMIILISMLISYNYCNGYWEESLGWIKDYKLSRVSTIDDKIFFINGQFLEYSYDLGITWEREFIGSFPSDIYFDDNKIFVSNSNTIFYSDIDKLNFSKIDIGIAIGRIYRIAVENSIIIASDVLGNFYYSLDFGLTWSENNQNLPSPYRFIRTLMIINSKVLISLSLSNQSGVPFTGGVFLLTDFDSNWQSTQIDNSISTFLYKDDDDNVYAGTDNGIYFSTDSGTNWELVSEQTVTRILSFENYLFARILPDNGKVGLYISGDNGLTWEFANIEGMINSICKVDDKILVATPENILLSDDYGTSWMSIFEVIEYGSANCICIYDDNLIVGTSNNISNFLYISSNNGDSWLPRSIDNQKCNVIEIYDNSIYIGNENSILISDDMGDSWRTILTDKNGMQINTVRSICKSGNKLLSGTRWGILISEDNGISWELQTENEFFMKSVKIKKYQDILFLFHSNLIYQSSNNGTSWELLTDEIPSTITSLDFIENNIFVGVHTAGLKSGVYFSEDFGTNWEYITKEDVFMERISSTNTFSKDVRGVFTFNNYIFASVEAVGIHISLDYGKKWESRNKGLPNDVRINIRDFVFNNEYFFIVLNGSLYRAKHNEIITNVIESTDATPPLSLYPNPTGDVLHIRTDELINRIELSDVIGNVVIRDLTPTLSKGEGVSINVENLPAGMYFLKLYTMSGEVLVGKVMIGF